MTANLSSWIGARISRKLFAVVATALLALSLVFLALFVTVYRDRLIRERATTSAQINGLLQVALENAMLKRDIDGLQNIVERLGEKSGIARVMILSPAGEVRFAAPARLVGLRFDPASADFCPGCGPLRADAVATAFLDDADARNVLRSVKQVANREPCTPCHGDTAANPVNGVLVIDYDAAGIRRDATSAAGALAGSGLLVLFGMGAAIAWTVRRTILTPVEHLSRATDDLAENRFEIEIPSNGRDEIASLAQAFRTMSQKIGAQQRELARREDLLQSVIDAVPDGIRVVTDDFRQVKVNKAYLTQQKLSAGDALASTCYATTHRRDEPCPYTLVTCPLHELRNANQPVTFRDTHRCADGREMPVEVSAAPVELLIDGKPRRCIVEAIRDLSADIHHSHEQRLSEIGQLAAGVAHEIRNPLSSIHLTLQDMRQADPATNRATFKTNLNLMDQEIDRCIQVTDRLLRLSSPPAEMPELVEMRTVIPEVVSLLSAEAERAGVEISGVFDGPLRVVATDSDMRMLVLNIAQNAFHAMPAGGTLTIRGRIEADRVVLSFADTGEGIDEKDMQHIFQPFWSRRADGAHGTGLGLPICREIVRRHGGSLRAESRRGAGATFTVSLPSADAAAPSP